MSSPGTAIDPLFWPLVIFAVTAAIFVAGIVIIVMTMARSRGVHIQQASSGGVIEHKPRSTPSLNVDKINVNSPQFPGGVGG